MSRDPQRLTDYLGHVLQAIDRIERYAGSKPPGRCSMCSQTLRSTTARAGAKESCSPNRRSRSRDGPWLHVQNQDRSFARRGQDADPHRPAVRPCLPVGQRANLVVQRREVLIAGKIDRPQAPLGQFPAT